MVLEKTLESPLNCKEIQPVHPKGDQSWVFIGRTDAKAEKYFTVALTVKRLSAMQETQVQSLSWEDPLEKEMAAHSSILAWRIP